MRRSISIIPVALVTLFVALSCNLFAPGVSESEVATQSAAIIEQGRMTATVIALQTQISALQTEAAKTIPAEASPTPTMLLPTQTPYPSATPLPSLTPLPSFTPIPPLPTATSIPCDQAGFVADVTIPDGTVVAPGMSFTKIWRIKNTGSCTWTTGYSLVFSSGERMGGASPQPLSANVKPGETIDVSVTLTAPTSEGKYRSSWKLRSASGVEFGLGSKNSAFYAEIVVKASPSGYAYDFVNSFCAAEWTSGAGTLTCPGSDGDSKGFVLRVEKAILETGSQDDEPALVTQPQAITDGIIRGKYPAYKVQDGDKFLAIVMCSYKATNCDVKFQLDYQIGSESIVTLASWNEKYDDKFQSVSVDLSSLAGKDVKFILTVMANGAMNQDRAQWLAPRIVHK